VQKRNEELSVINVGIMFDRRVGDMRAEESGINNEK